MWFKELSWRCQNPVLSQRGYYWTMPTLKITLINFPEARWVSGTPARKFGVLVRDGLCVKGLGRTLGFPVSVTRSLVEWQEWQRGSRGTGGSPSQLTSVPVHTCIQHCSLGSVSLHEPLTQCFPSCSTLGGGKENKGNKQKEKQIAYHMCKWPLFCYSFQPCLVKSSRKEFLFVELVEMPAEIIVKRELQN